MVYYRAKITRVRVLSQSFIQRHQLIQLYNDTIVIVIVKSRFVQRHKRELAGTSLLVNAVIGLSGRHLYSYSQPH